MLLIQVAQTKNKRITVVAESLPHLKKGAMRDFMDIMKAHQYYSEANHNKSDHIYNFDSGSYIEFLGVDEPKKVRGPRRDILFINECNNVPFGVFEQMEPRTRNTVFLDYNPVSEFWVHTEIIPKHEHDFLKLTYKDNEALEKSIIKSIESRKDNVNWWRVYGLGEVGSQEGQVFDGWQIIDRVPVEAELKRKGLDFGYTNDPAALVDVYRYNGGFVLDELLYRKGVTNKQIADFLKAATDATVLTIADSAEPKSIDEIKSYGVRITGAVKGQGSVNYGIQLMQDVPIWVTKRSTNLIKEYRNYLWKTDKDGKPLNVPEDMFNHGMDASRYAISDIMGVGTGARYDKSRIGL